MPYCAKLFTQCLTVPNISFCFLLLHTFHMVPNCAKNSKLCLNVPKISHGVLLCQTFHTAQKIPHVFLLCQIFQTAPYCAKKDHTVPYCANCSKVCLTLKIIPHCASLCQTLDMVPDCAKYSTLYINVPKHLTWCPTVEDCHTTKNYPSNFYHPFLC